MLDEAPKEEAPQDYNEVQEMVRNQRQHDVGPDDEDDKSGMDEMDTQIRQSMAGGANAVFARAGGPAAKLEDFNLRKLIGKGTFGKVFLVELGNTGKLFAMKCIRKDIIIENDQMDNI